MPVARRGFRTQHRRRDVDDQAVIGVGNVDRVGRGFVRDDDIAAPGNGNAPRLGHHQPATALEVENQIAIVADIARALDASAVATGVRHRDIADRPARQVRADSGGHFGDHAGKSLGDQRAPEILPPLVRHRPRGEKLDRAQ